jgi:hypothetical protein
MLRRAAHQRPGTSGHAQMLSTSRLSSMEMSPDPFISAT